MDYRKLMWAILGTVAVAVQGALTDGSFSVQEVVMTCGMVLAAVATWLVPNTPALMTAKTWVTALVIGAGVLEPIVIGGVTTQEWVTVVLAVLTAAGVYAFPGPRSQYDLAA